MPPDRAPVAAAWAFASSHGATTYETLLYPDGTLSCDCPGWVFQKAGRPRGCRHTKDLGPYAAAVLDGRLSPEEAGARAGALPSHPLEALGFAAASPARPRARPRRRSMTPSPPVSPLTGRLRRQLDLR